MDWLKSNYLLLLQDKWQPELKTDFKTLPITNNRPKFYLLEMIPHPTAEGLSINHCRNYVYSDVIARYKRMQFYNVLYPMGWDSFGVTTEKRALSQGSEPSKLSLLSARSYREQMTRLGLSYDWSAEITTSSPEYYKWTQWFFLLLYSRGLVYQKEESYWWCNTCKKALRYAEVDGIYCKKCGNPKIRAKSRQWFARITDYADELMESLQEVDWPQSIIDMQRQRLLELKDWSISRKRYWGAPVPIIYCGKDGVVPATNLPVTLPEIPWVPRSNEHTISLAEFQDFANTCCPICGGPANRDLDVLSSAVCSSWYYLRFIDAHNQHYPFDMGKVKYWMPVDCLIGNAEQTNGFLLYARFTTKVLADAGFLTIREPFVRFILQGVVSGSDGKRMTKNNNNVIGINSFIDQYGSDVVRFGLLSLGKRDSSTAWNNLNAAMKASKRFFGQIIQWASSIQIDGQEIIQSEYELPDEILRQFISVTHALEKYDIYQYIIELKLLFKCIKQLDEEISNHAGLKRHVLSYLVRMLSLVAPFLSQELWSQAGFEDRVQKQSWPISENSNFS